jgi:GAF domain-containing protein
MSGVLTKIIDQIEMPENETERLAAMEKYRVLDTDHEKNFDEIVTLASQICYTPVAVITFLDANRQWVKVKTGWDSQQTARKIAFCSHTLLQDDVMMINDSTKDLGFRNNPLVTGAPLIRFYAGMPLIAPDGFKLGTLAVIDFEPRTLSMQQIAALRTLSKQVVTLLELRLNNIKLTESNLKNSYLANLLEHTDDVVYSTELNGIISSRMAAAEKLFDVKRERGHW